MKKSLIKSLSRNFENSSSVNNLFFGDLRGILIVGIMDGDIIVSITDDVDVEGPCEESP